MNPIQNITLGDTSEARTETLFTAIAVMLVELRKRDDLTVKKWKTLTESVAKIVEVQK